MSGLVTVTSDDAPFPREVLHGAGKSTVLDWLFQRDGDASSVTAATVYLKSGSTTLATYTTGGGGVTITGGKVTCAIDGDDFTQISLFTHLWVALTVTADGAEERFGERVLVTDLVTRCPCNLGEVLDLHPDFLDPSCYQTGHTETDDSPGWAYVLERVWADIRLSIWTDYPQIDLSRIRSAPALRPWIRYQCAMEIAEALAGDRGRQSDLLAAAERWGERAMSWGKKSRTLVRDASSTAFPDEPALRNDPVVSPAWITARNDEGFI